MEKFLFAKLEMWVVVLLALLGVVGTVGFGALVLDSERGQRHYGLASDIAHNIAQVPDTAKKLLKPNRDLMAYSNAPFRGKPTGWSFPSGPMRAPDGYLLLSRYDGNAHRHAIELVSMPDMKVRHRWTLETAALLKGVTHISPFSDSDNWTASRFRQIHPIPVEDGGLIVKDHYSPLTRVDACGKALWTIQSQIFHHSTEAAADGTLWIPGLAERHSLERIKDSFREDMLTQVSPDGRILRNIFVPQILLRHGYQNWLFANDMYNDDPTHLNDIQPVLADGPYWKKGDLFVSLRNISSIMLYRPSTDQIVWMKRGPWLSQHDVDILDDHRISVYDNNVQDRGGGLFFDGSSQIMIYDFATGAVTQPLKRAMDAARIRTATAGLYTALPGGASLIEDVTGARMLIVDAGGKLVAEYVNRAEDGEIYHLGWTRYMDRARGDAMLRAVGKAKCNA